MYYKTPAAETSGKKAANDYSDVFLRIIRCIMGDQYQAVLALLF